MLENVICTAAGKGGVGKTSVSANLAGLSALSGWKTLLIDLDPQANLCDELGVLDDPRYDDGLGLLTAVLTGTRPVVMQQVRPGLDLIPAGPSTKDLRGLFVLNPNGSNLLRLRDVLVQLHGDYDLIIIDTPPASDPLVKAALAASRFLLLTTKGDLGSIRGLVQTSEVYASVVGESLNPDLEVLGIVLFSFNPKHTVRLQNAVQRIHETLGGVPIEIFDTIIRTAERTAEDVRDEGELVFEYANKASSAPAWYEMRKRGGEGTSFGSNSDSLAQDYVNLWCEVRDVYLRRRRELAEVTR